MRPIELLAQVEMRLMARENQLWRDFPRLEIFERAHEEARSVPDDLYHSRLAGSFESSFDLNVSQSPVHNYVLTSAFVSAKQRAVSAR